jgi:hypothetical protein
MSDERILLVLRAQAWERAKAELKSVAHTFYDDPDGYDKYHSLIDELIDAVEREGLHE